MILRKHDKLLNADYYFAGYDPAQPDYCNWQTSIAAAVCFTRKDLIEKLVNYLFVNSKVNTKIFTLEVIDIGQLSQKTLPRQLQNRGRS